MNSNILHSRNQSFPERFNVHSTQHLSFQNCAEISDFNESKLDSRASISEPTSIFNSRCRSDKIRGLVSVVPRILNTLNFHQLSLDDFEIISSSEHSNFVAHVAYVCGIKPCTKVKAQLVQILEPKHGQINLKRMIKALRAAKEYRSMTCLRAVVTEKGKIHLVLRYEPGLSLEHIMNANREEDGTSKLSLYYCLLVIVQVLETLTYLHSKYITHGSIRADNILDSNILHPSHLKDPPCTSDIRLIGFSKARVWRGNEKFTRKYQLAEELDEYSYPTSDARENIDARKQDIYACGALLCQLIDGSFSFRYDNNTSWKVKKKLFNMFDVTGSGSDKIRGRENVANFIKALMNPKADLRPFAHQAHGEAIQLINDEFPSTIGMF